MNYIFILIYFIVLDIIKIQGSKFIIRVIREGEEGHKSILFLTHILLSTAIFCETFAEICNMGEEKH